MESVLVTGGTGRLGREVARRLADGQREVRVLSRRPAPTGAGGGLRRMVGDLRTGRGLDAAVAGVDTIVHAATLYGRADVAAARTLVAAARRAGRDPHLVYVSIVGSDAIPLGYYRAKAAAGRIIEESGLPWTIQRTTQFHNLVAGLFAWQRWLPVTVAAAGFRFQPIDVRDAAARLVDLAGGPPAGAAPDVGGPEVATMRRLAAIYGEAHGRRRVAAVRIPGAIARGFAAGGNLALQNPFGTVTFAEFVAERAAEARR